MPSLNCEWAQALTRYDCQTLRALDGGPCLEIGTPFSLPDGSAINLYLTHAAEGMVKISDNADTMFQLGGMGLDVWNAARRSAVRDLMGRHRMGMGEQGDLFLIAKEAQAANGFATAITGLLALTAWAREHLAATPKILDIFAEIEPWIIARDASAIHKLNPKVKGASGTDYSFDVQHGKDLIDVIGADARSTGAAMRKAGDVQNGPYANELSPLVVVYDLIDSEKAMQEIAILGSVTRAIPASRLMKPLH